MSDAKHTPGPWVHATDIGQIGSIETSDGVVIAQAQPLVGDTDRAIRDANARLIAAAPELLTALEEAIRWIGRLTDWEGAGDPDIDKWRAAHNKAKGEQS